jgi:hypothetical protein
MNERDGHITAGPAFKFAVALESFDLIGFVAGARSFAGV